MTDETKPFYVIYPDETAGTWRIQAVPVSPDSFESRKALPEVWRGLRDEKLSEVSGIDGGIFVHASGFIGGTSVRFVSTLGTELLTCSQATSRRKGRWHSHAKLWSCREKNVRSIYRGSAENADWVPSLSEEC